MVVSMKLDAVYYDLILNGKKIYETRVFDEKRQKLKLKDKIEFTSRDTGETFTAEIVELTYFSTFRQAIEDCGLKKVMPNVRSVNDAVKMYENFPHDTGNYKKGAIKYGVLRIKFNLL